MGFFLDKKTKKRCFVHTILRKQDAGGAYIWASIKKLIWGGGG